MEFAVLYKEGISSREAHATSLFGNSLFSHPSMIMHAAIVIQYHGAISKPK